MRAISSASRRKHSSCRAGSIGGACAAHVSPRGTRLSPRRTNPPARRSRSARFVKAAERSRRQSPRRCRASDAGVVGNLSWSGFTAASSPSAASCPPVPNTHSSKVGGNAKGASPSEGSTLDLRLAASPLATDLRPSPMWSPGVLGPLATTLPRTWSGSKGVGSFAGTERHADARPCVISAAL